MKCRNVVSNKWVSDQLNIIGSILSGATFMPDMPDMQDMQGLARCSILKCAGLRNVAVNTTFLPGYLNKR